MSFCLEVFRGGSICEGLDKTVFLAALVKYTRRMYGHFQQEKQWYGLATHGSGQPYFPWAALAQHSTPSSLLHPSIHTNCRQWPAAAPTRRAPAPARSGHGCPDQLHQQLCLYGAPMPCLLAAWARVLQHCLDGASVELLACTRVRGVQQEDGCNRALGWGGSGLMLWAKGKVQATVTAAPF